LFAVLPEIAGSPVAFSTGRRGGARDAGAACENALAAAADDDPISVRMRAADAAMSGVRISESPICFGLMRRMRDAKFLEDNLRLWSPAELNGQAGG